MELETASPPDQPTGAEQRISNFLLRYWETISGDRNYPRSRDFNFADIEAIADTCFLVKAEGGSFSYMYLGSDLVDAYGSKDTAQEACERLAFPSSNALSEKFREVVRTRKPVSRDGSFRNTKGIEVRYRCILLPLSDEDNGEVRYIVGGMRWKAYL